ncbi:hypothetical protein HZA57_06730 [Candidatus Poribacteria bacterium]|nr:hypothetical protein [Candidatus Poribacteria bacterium]
MTNAEKILRALDARLDAKAELTLYGRAALLLGFANPQPEYALSHDVDAVLWLGQAEELARCTNFWEAVEQVNEELATRGLYVSHFFVEDQVILRAAWRENRKPIGGGWRRLSLFRLGDLDLLLSKLMRDDPIDRQDALFIVRQAGLGREVVEDVVRQARVPDIPELREQFARATHRLLETMPRAAGVPRTARSAPSRRGRTHTRRRMR